MRQQLLHTPRPPQTLSRRCRGMLLLRRRTQKSDSECVLLRDACLCRSGVGIRYVLDRVWGTLGDH